MNNGEQQKVIVHKSLKNPGLGIILAILLGPLGLLYSSISAGLLMIAITFVLVFFTLGLGLYFLPLINIICGVWAYKAIKDYNKKLLEERA